MVRPALDVSAGSELLGYRIEELAGRGGMGAVYRATHLRLNRTVALKLLAPELAEDERFRDRFLRESELAAALEHPHVIPVYDAGETNGQLYLVMRWVDGEDLGGLLAREGRLEPGRALAIVAQVAAGLDAAHARGLVHRDVKPANVLLEPRAEGEHAFLSDFGVARSVAGASALTGTGELLGTVDYVAPEQLQGRSVDGRADLYSLACLLYECLTGEPPFKRETQLTTLWAHVNEPAPALTKARPELPRTIDAVLAKALAKAPTDRYPSCGAFAEAARAALPPDTAVTLPVRSRIRSRRAWIVAAISAVVGGALAATLALVLSGGSDHQAETPSAEPAPAASTAPVAPPPAPPPAGEAAPAEFIGAVRIDAATNEVVARIAQRGHSIAVGEGAVWLLDEHAGVLYKISPSFNTLVDEIDVPRSFAPGGAPNAAGVVAGRGGVWANGTDSRPTSSSVASGYREQVVRIDPETNRASEPIETGAICCGVLVPDVGAVWDVAFQENRTLRIDAATGEIDEFAVAGTDAALGGGKLWVLDRLVGNVRPIDPDTDRIGQPVSLRGDPVSLAVAYDALWIADAGGEVARVPLAGDSAITSVSLDGTPVDVAAGAGAVWVATVEGALYRIEPETMEVVDSTELPGYPAQLAVGAGGIWVVISAGPRPPR